jgi:hypothetical protein
MYITINRFGLELSQHLIIAAFFLFVTSSIGVRFQQRNLLNRRVSIFRLKVQLTDNEAFERLQKYYLENNNLEIDVQEAIRHIIF